MVVARILSWLWALVIAPLSVFLLISAEFPRGRLCACLALLSAILPLAISMARKNRRWMAGIVGGGALWLALLVTMLAVAPTGRTPAHGRVAHVFATKGDVFPRYSPGNLVPESDQLLLGLRLVPLVDPILNTTGASELRHLTASIYRELESDSDFHALGSMLSDTYDGLFDQNWRPSHSYVYVPTNVDRSKPRPVLMFFHGSGGNFKAYLWILSKLADRLGWVLVAPGGGFGEWTSHDSQACLDNAIEAAARHATIDLTRVHIMGLSNGGRAISQLASRQGARFASMTFLSPVFDVPEVLSQSFAVQCNGRRVLIVTGRVDDRVPWDYVEENAADMRTAGAQVTLRTFEQADHFLMFSHRDQLLTLLERWLSDPSSDGVRQDVFAK